ncbi:MAG: AtpZ/AtpI family protein [Elusimicrobia bacterium]|nr:AtpZ/AtpI family protein [Elusimicrobiota bacterium]
MKPWTRFLGIGLQLTGAILMGFFVGYWLDKKLGTQPWCMLAGAALGMAAGFYNFIKESLEE